MSSPGTLRNSGNEFFAVLCEHYPRFRMTLYTADGARG